jgi:two-component system CheB/CheR fusion protein
LSRYLPLEIALSPITTSLGLLVVAAVRDISERRRVEQSLNDARTEAQRANRAKSRFLRAASHDLRQPLQVMRLLQGALAAKITDATGKGMLHRLEDTADAMNGVLAAFVDVSQIETGTITPSIVEFPVFGLLTRLRTDFGTLANAKGLILRVVPSSAKVRSDPRLLERILGNLVSNAVKCTRNGKVLLGCRRHGATLRIEVWDTGAGIAPEHDSDILEEFYQVSPSDNRSDISFDIGLYIVEQLARLLGHPLSVRSSPGKGAMFSIAVPLLEHRVGDNGATASTAAATDNAPLVLVVEDDEAQRDALRLLLSVHGYTVETAATGPEAVIQVSGSSGFRPDIVLAGYNLGGAMTGVEIVRQIASRIGRPVPAVIMTGDLSATTSCAVADAGMKLLHKPVRLDALLDTVGDLAAMAAGQQAETRHPLLAADARTGPATIAIIDDDVGVGTAASLGVGEPERYLRVCCLTRGWMRGLDCEAGENRG